MKNRLFFNQRINREWGVNHPQLDADWANFYNIQEMTRDKETPLEYRIGRIYDQIKTSNSYK